MLQDITPQELNEFAGALEGDRSFAIARNAATSMGVRTASKNPIVYRSYQDTYSVSLTPTSEVTNQRQSGRCWMFATLNVLRDRMMSEMGVKSLELSQAYLQFYDKLEKANLFLENMIRLIDEPIDSREMTLRLDAPVPDGGWWDMAVVLIEKYGVLPKACMPDSANACATSDLNELLNRKMRAVATNMRAQHAAGADETALRDLKKQALADVYRMLSVALGEPPARFDFDFVADERPAFKPAGDPEALATPEALAARKAAMAEDARFVRLTNVTPLEFFKRYCHVNLHEYVSLGHVPGDGRPFGSILQLDHDGSVQGVPIRMINEPIDVLKNAVIAQLKAGHPAWFACDVTKLLDRTDASGLLDTESLDTAALFGVDYNACDGAPMTKAQSYDARETKLNHAMTFQGVNLTEDGTPTAWRVENSWGTEKCKNGYFILTDRYFDAYVGQVIVHRDYVPADVVAAWESPATPVVEMKPWQPLLFGMSD
ncbi:MAG: C1 family peptidase [Coriobacteriia bacterium]|nr:C1 family peptidase [Coriobacteriia bacterium]MBS5477976.1 C1 family peptidase [Coriobacteriia bacterium]